MVNQNRQLVGMEDLGQGGIFEAVLTVKEAYFDVKQFDSGNSAFQVSMTYTKEDGQDVHWSYNVGDAANWDMTPDRLGAIPLRHGGKISKNSTFGVFLTELANAGFPNNRRTNTLDFLVGTTFQSKSFVPEGTNMDGGPRKEVLVPGLIISLPGEDAGKAATAPWDEAPVARQLPPTPSTPVPSKPVAPVQQAMPSAPVASNGTAAVSGLALSAALKLGDHYTLQGVMAQVMQDLAGDPLNRDAAAGFVFNPEFAKLLSGAGFQVNGYNVSR
jgi:hypothetical protein